MLKNGLVLKDVLYVPAFNHNLLSIHKLAQDNDCEIQFSPEKCIIKTAATVEIRGIGLLRNGLYFLEDSEVQIDSLAANNLSKMSNSVLWHNRLGHAPLVKNAQIPQIRSAVTVTNMPECVTCPLARFTKLPFTC